MSLARGTVAALVVGTVSAVATAALVATMPAGAFRGAVLAPTPSPSSSLDPLLAHKEAVPDPPPVLAWGPAVSEWDDALETAQALTLSQAAGQVIIAAWNSPDAAGAAALVTGNDLGGIILMQGALSDAAQVSALTAAIEEAAASDGRDWPAMIATDQEGGPVARLAGIVPDLPSFMAAGSATDKSTVEEAYAASGASMAGLGFTVDYAPVADVTVGLADPTIRVRSAGSDPNNVASTVVAAMNGYLAGGVIPTLKHFPGHGSVETDSHKGLPVQTATLAQLEQRDFVPFREAIDAGAPAVMMAHVVVGEWGGGPATMSPAAYDYLRDDMGFTGVVFTDGMNMDAVTDLYSPGEAAVAAIGAGADVLLIPPDVSAAHDALVAAVTAGTLPRARLDEAAARSILLMRWQRQLAVAVPATHESAQAFAASSATVATQTCGAPLVGSTVSISGGFESERAALAGALAGYGIGTGGGTTVKLLGAADGHGNADVVVAMDGPWGLANSHAGSYVGLYGRSPDALAGLAAVLAGAVVPHSQWPVDLSALPYAACTGG